MIKSNTILGVGIKQLKGLIKKRFILKKGVMLMNIYGISFWRLTTIPKI